MAVEPATIESLPTELVSHIFDYLAVPPPSDTRLHDQPSPRMLKGKSDGQDLKTVSLVSKRWRAISLPVLFRHVEWTLDRWDLLLVEPANEPDPVSALPLLAFLRAHDLARHVESLTMVVSDSMQGMYRLPEAGKAPDTTRFATARSALDTPGATSSLITLFDAAGRGVPQHPQVVNRAAAYNEDNNWVWKMLFELMDPRRFTIISSPQMLASLMSRMLFLGDSWSFKNPCHILSLSRDARPASQPHPAAERPLAAVPSATEQASSSSTSCSKCSNEPKRAACELFTIRPWTSLLLNEGSSTRVYKTYEFFLKRPPSVLGALLGCEEAPNDVPLIPESIKSLYYVAIFPLSSHFNSLVCSLPRLDKLFVQLVPRNNILQDPEEMKNVLTSDLWMERNTCYSLVMRELLARPGEDDQDEDDLWPNSTAHRPNNWRNLREFESGDAADKKNWDMAVQFVRMSGTGWRVEREGVFVKGPKPESATGAGSGIGSGSSDDDDEDDDDGSDPGGLGFDMDDAVDGFNIFQDKLVRVAFRGTAELPFSPSQPYSHGWTEDWEDDEFVVDTGIEGVHPLSAPWGGVGGLDDWDDQEIW